MEIKKAVKRANNVGVSVETTKLMKKFLETMDDFKVTITLAEVVITHSRGTVVLYDW